MSAPRRAGGSTIPERQGRSAPEARALGLVGRARGADGLANELALVDVIGVLLTRPPRRSQRTEIRRTRYDERSRGRHRWRQSRETRKLRISGVRPGSRSRPPLPDLETSQVRRPKRIQAVRGAPRKDFIGDLFSPRASEPDRLAVLGRRISCNRRQRGFEIFREGGP